MAKSLVRVVSIAAGLVLVAVGGGYVGSRIDDSKSDESTGGGLAVREVIGGDIPDDEQTREGITLKIAQARCAEGEVLTGGGYRIFGASPAIESQVQVNEAVAGLNDDNTPNVWTVWAHAPEGIGDWGFDARAFCAKGSG